MATALCIGALPLGGRPLVAVPFDDRATRAGVQSLVARGLDVAELRVDLFGSFEAAHVQGVLPVFAGVPTLATEAHASDDIRRTPCASRIEPGSPIDVCDRLAYIMGTSACIMATTVDPRFVPGVWGPYYSGMVPGFWLNEGGQSAAGAAVDHLLRSHPAHAEAAATASASIAPISPSTSRSIGSAPATRASTARSCSRSTRTRSRRSATRSSSRAGASGANAMHRTASLATRPGGAATPR